MSMESHPLRTSATQTKTSQVTVITDESFGFYMSHKNIKTFKPKGFFH